MPDNPVSVIMMALFLGLWVVYMVRLLIRAVKNKYAPVKTVPAVVVDKQIVEAFSKYSGNGKQQKYVIVFSAEGKKKSFYVSQFSYGGYRVNEKGTLKYKGDKLIDFH